MAPPEQWWHNHAMPPVIPERMTAKVDGDFVVFLIGMRINKPLKLHKWIPAGKGTA